MSRPSPTLEGFRAAFRQPSLALAEIAWRWSVGATACTLLGFAFFEYLNTLPVNSGELLFLRSRHPILISRAIAHILRGSLTRVSLAALLAVLAVTVLWIFAASLGRAITVRALLNHFSDRFVPDSAPESAPPPTARGEACAPQPSTADGNVIDSPAVRFAERGKRFFPASLLALNFLRAAITLAAWFALVGASILAGFASTDRNPHPGLAFLFFLPLAALVGGLWLMLNWFLSLAALFAVRNGNDHHQDALSAISAAFTLCHNRFGHVMAVSAWFGLAHIAAFMGASTVSSFSLGFVGVLPGRAVLATLTVLALIYFAVVDWLYTARLAGYVCIAEMPDALFAPAHPLPLAPPSGGPQFAPSAPLAASIDREERILSDVPKLAVETLGRLTRAEVIRF
jgi:hypothetical protein